MQILAESLRVSLFASVPFDIRQIPLEEWWRAVGGGEPEQVARNLSNFQLTADGPYSKGRLFLGVTQGRADWQATPPTPTADGSAPPHFDAWPVSVGPFVQQISEWLPAFKSLRRLAFGAVLRVPVLDRSCGYKTIETALSELAIDLPDDLSDFLLQMNRPTQSTKLAGMTINRVSRWSVALFRQVWFQLTLSAAASTTVSSGLPDVPEDFAVRIELDFNTAAEWAEDLQGAKPAALLNELSESAIDYLMARIAT
jgi:hypothetical protein